jgi:hypothetical protein
MNEGRGWIVSALALAAVVAISVLALASVAPAGNRNPTPVLKADPGPANPTRGQAVAYTAELKNDQKSTFTQLKISNKAPLFWVAGETQPRFATFEYASCNETKILAADQQTVQEITCDLPQLPSGQTSTVTVVWRTLGVGTSDDPNTAANECGPSATAPCMNNQVTYTIKEGTGKPGSAGPDTFASNVESVPLLAVPDPTRARGYALEKCTDGTSLATVAVGEGNPLSTSVCATSVPGEVASPLSPGLNIQIDEGTGQFNKGVTQTSFICIPAPKSETNSGLCPAVPGYFNTGYQPWSFDDPATTNIVEKGRFTFVIQLDPGEFIEEVFHNGVLVTPQSEPNVTVDIDNFPNLKLAIVTVESPTQGGWDFG